MAFGRVLIFYFSISVFFKTCPEHCSVNSWQWINNLMTIVINKIIIITTTAPCGYILYIAWWPKGEKSSDICQSGCSTSCNPVMTQNIWPKLLYHWHHHQKDPKCESYPQHLIYQQHRYHPPWHLQQHHIIVWWHRSIKAILINFCFQYKIFLHIAFDQYQHQFMWWSW